MDGWTIGLGAHRNFIKWWHDDGVAECENGVVKLKLVEMESLMVASL